jgi:hypothetical protein
LEGTIHYSVQKQKAIANERKRNEGKKEYRGLDLTLRSIEKRQNGDSRQLLAFH